MPQNAPSTWKRTAIEAAVLGLAIGVVGLVNLNLEAGRRVLPLDLDGWGHLIPRLREVPAFAQLFSDPSLWKGPVVPFVFGLTYYLFPVEWSPLVLNAACGGLAGAVLYYGFKSMVGYGAVLTAAALLAWAVFPPHRFVVAYYFAEPLASLLVALFVVTSAFAMTRRSTGVTCLAGGLGAVLLLSRPTYVLLVILTPLLFWFNLPRSKMRLVSVYALAFLLVWAPWPIRNYVRYGEFIPFTTEGGRTVFMSVYLPGDDGQIGYLRAIPEYAGHEKTAATMDPITEYRYWQALAAQEMKKDPTGQVRLLVKKAMRLWMYVPEGTWRPTALTLTAALLYIPLAFAGFWTLRRDVLIQMLGLAVVSLWIVHTFLHSELRYNYPVLAAVFLLASIPFRRFAERARS